jgi:hypothetical protein
VDQPPVVTKHGLAVSNVTNLKRNVAIIIHQTVLNKDACAYTFLTLSPTHKHLFVLGFKNALCYIFGYSMDQTHTAQS